MNEVINKSYAEELQDSDVSSSNGHMHGVYHPKKPDKICMVFDCSADFKEHSLNKHLLPGPDLTNGLIGVLQ